jgi:F-type H+-transporting ATPase subunit b
MEIIKTNALITINETLWVQMIIFLIFLFLINRVMFRPVRRNMAEREDYFAALRQAILALKEEMGALYKETQAEEKRLRASAWRTVEELRQAGRQESDRLMNQALKDIKDQHLTAEKELAASLAIARREIEAEASHLTTSIIQRLIDGRP